MYDKHLQIKKYNYFIAGFIYMKYIRGINRQQLERCTKIRYLRLYNEY